MTPEEFEQQAVAQLPTMMAVALRLAGARGDAEDLVQEALLKAFRARHQFRPGSNLRAWLVRILRNTFLNGYRRRGVARRVFEESQDDAMARSVGAASLRAVCMNESEQLYPQLEEQLTAALDELPSDFRMAVLLADVEDLSYREIAEALGCPIGTVMSRLHRGRRMLRGRLIEQARALGIAPEEPDESREAILLSDFKRKRGTPQ